MSKNLNSNKLAFQKNKFFAAILALLMMASILLVFSGTELPTAKAQTTTIPSNLLQYEWPDQAGTIDHSMASEGPGPSAPNIAWKAQIPGATGYLTAFDGMVFTEGNGNTYALDAATGQILWTATGLANSRLKIDDNYMLIGTTCVKTADGSKVWTAPAGFSPRASVYQGTIYIPELKMFADQNYGWSLPDPSKQPTLAWNRTSNQIYGTERCLGYGDGKIFLGSYDNFLICIDAKTGTTLWITPTTGGFVYGGSYIDGKFIHGALDNSMHCWDANTGKLLWTYDPGTWYGMWASATAAAYGMVYEHNQDTYLYAINATNGQLVWKQKGPGIGYSNTFTIAGGKVYCQMGEKQYRDFETGEYATSEFDCFDAYTGALIWSMPLENGAPFNLQCNAYGNLYVVPNEPTPQEEGVWTYSMSGVMTLGEVWCISSESVNWPMAYAGPEHSSEGAGPTNLALKWNFTTSSTVQSAPTLVDGVCYFGNQLGTIYALNAESGSQLWTFQTDHWVKSSVAVVNGKVYTGTDDGNVYCLNAATGTKIWETPAGGVVMNPLGTGGLGTQSLTIVGADNSRSSPMVVNGRVYVGALDGNLYCIDASSGAVVWKFQTGGPIQATPTIVDNAIFIPSSTPRPNGTVYKLDLNGKVVWQTSIPYVLDKSIGYGFYLLASATVADGKVFVRNGLRLNYALDENTGQILWTYDGQYNPGTPNQLGGVTQFMPMLYKYGRLYFNDFYGITCLNASDGTKIWSNWLSRENLAQGLSYSYQRIYTVTEFGVLYVIDALSGEKLSYYEFSPLRSQLHCMPIPYNGNLYVGTNDWNMYCFGDARIMSAGAATPQAQTLSSLQVQAPSIVTPSTPASTPTIVYIALTAVIVIAASATIELLRRKRK
jgi:outer membrane protein assembly factor BamB